MKVKVFPQWEIEYMKERTRLNNWIVLKTFDVIMLIKGADASLIMQLTLLRCLTMKEQ